MSRNDTSRFSSPTESEETVLASVSVDTVFDLLAHPGRRYVLSYVLERGDANCYELVEYALDRTDDYDRQTEGEVRGRLVTSFRETHLPALADADLVRYDEEADFVGRTSATETVRPFLDLASEYQQDFVAQAES
jgi:hypothetical protein